VPTNIKEAFHFLPTMKLTLGKVANSGSHVERAKTPPSV